MILTIIGLIFCGVAFLIYISANRDMKFAKLMQDATIDKLQVDRQQMFEERKALLETHKQVMSELNILQCWLVAAMMQLQVEDERYEQAQIAKDMLEKLMKRTMK